MSNLNEVAPSGWGHTKAEKEKTKPDKPKSKIGGTAAAFKRALDDGRFKGLPGSTTKKEKTADMFKLMYSMKKKGAKPHYKPGTDKKYKKYQEDWKPEIEHIKGSDLRKKAAEKKRKAAADSLPPHLKLDAMKKAFASTNEETNIDENVGTGRARRAKMGNVQPKTVGAVSNAERDIEFKKKKAKDAAKDKAVASKVDVSGLSPYDALIKRKAAEKKAERIRLRTEETSMPNLEKKDRGAIKKRFKGLFKKDVKGTVQGVNEGDLHKKMNTLKTDATKRKSDNSLGTISSATKRYEMLRKIIGSKKKPTKPAIKEEKDKKLTMIVKQLRKSVKSHGKQADYIEKINHK